MRRWYPLFLVCIIALLYLPFLHNAFVSDDISGIVDSMPHWTWIQAIGWPRVVHLGVLFQFWAYQLFGLVPWPFRLTNILFHMGNVVLVYGIVRKRSKLTIAFVASLLFAIHPLVIESVTWISGGVYAHYSFFFLLSLYFYIHFSSSLFSVLSSLFFFLSLCISEKALPLVFIFLLYEWVYGNIKKNWRCLMPYCIVSICFILFYISRLSLRMTGLELANYQSVSGLHNPLLQIPVAISSYLALFFVPIKLTLYHASFHYTFWEFGIRVVVTLGYLGWMGYALIKQKPIGFWLAWVVVSLGVTLLPLKISWIVAERYVYLGLVGLSVAVAVFFDAVVSRKRWSVLVICMGILVLMLFCTQTVLRNNEWRTADSLWVATLRESPEDPHSWNNMGDVYSRHGEYEKGIAAFTQATTINPNYADAYHNIGNTYLHMKAYDQAIPYYEKALSINPNLWQSYQDLSFIASVKGDYKQAIYFIEKALNINPTDPVLLENAQVLHNTVGY